MEECKPSNENNREVERTQEEYYRRMALSRISKIHNQYPPMERNQEENYRRTTPFRISPRYQTMKATLELIISESLMKHITETITFLAH
jgi:hypothetical protein